MDVDDVDIENNAQQIMALTISKLGRQLELNNAEMIELLVWGLAYVQSGASWLPQLPPPNN